MTCSTRRTRLLQGCSCRGLLLPGQGLGNLARKRTREQSLGGSFQGELSHHCYFFFLGRAVLPLWFEMSSLSQTSESPCPASALLSPTSWLGSAFLDKHCCSRMYGPGGPGGGVVGAYAPSVPRACHAIEGPATAYSSVGRVWG